MVIFNNCMSTCCMKINFGFNFLEERWIEEDMSSVPQAAFAAKKIRSNEEKLNKFHENSPGTSLLAKYNDKYMNSVWGMYNRYSVHNLKKVMEYDNIASTSSSQKNLAAIKVPEQSSVDNKGCKSNKGAGIRIPSPLFLYSPM